MLLLNNKKSSNKEISKKIGDKAFNVFGFIPLYILREGITDITVYICNTAEQVTRFIHDSSKIYDEAFCNVTIGESGEVFADYYNGSKSNDGINFCKMKVCGNA